MADSGARRLPDNLHFLRGTHRKDRHGTPQQKLQPTGRAPDRPDHLDEHGTRLWDGIVQEYEAMGCLSWLDGPALEAYCNLYSRFRRDPDGVPVNLLAQLRIYANEFAGTVSARAKMLVQNPDEDDDGL